MSLLLTVWRLALGVVIFAVATRGEAAEFVYGPTSVNTPRTGGKHFTTYEFGNQVRLGGAARSLVSFQIGVTRQLDASSADFQARFYANDGPNGEPGTLLYETSYFANVTITDDIQSVGWGFAPVAVPDEFTWTVQISNPNVGLIPVHPPLVAGESLTTWLNVVDDGGWRQTDGQTYEAYMFAVPEPSASALFCFAIAASFGCHRQRRTRVRSRQRQLTT